MDEEREELILAEPKSSGSGSMSSPRYHSVLSVHRHEKQCHCVIFIHPLSKHFLEIIFIYFYVYFGKCWVSLLCASVSALVAVNRGCSLVAVGRAVL